MYTNRITQDQMDTVLTKMRHIATIVMPIMAAMGFGLAVRIVALVAVGLALLFQFLQTSPTV